MKPRLFSEALNERADEFKKYLPVNINLRFETVASHLALCEENYIRPLLGDSLFSRLVDFYAAQLVTADDSSVSEVVAAGDSSEEDSVDSEQQLLDMVRFALVRLAIWKGYDVISAVISDTGVSQEVDKENRLYHYQEENIKRSLKNEGFDYLDNVLGFLEKHVEEFPEFADSPYKLSAVHSLIRNTRMFDECYDIAGSRLVYLKMRQYVRDVELIDLQHRIGTDFYAELLDADESEAKYKAIMPAIRRYVVYTAVAEGIGELHKLPTEKGLVFESSTLEGVSESPVTHSQVAETRMLLAKKAEMYLASALNYMTQHKSDYPNYIVFAGESPVDGVIHRDNTGRKTWLA